MEDPPPSLLPILNPLNLEFLKAWMCESIEGRPMSRSANLSVRKVLPFSKLYFAVKKGEMSFG